MRRLPGGFNRGAYELKAREGERAVLKWFSAAEANHEPEGTAALLDAARGDGWETPRWLAHGTTPDGTQFVIEEFVDGRQARHDEHDLGLILAVNPLQAGRGTAVTRDWSRWNWRVLWEDEGGYQARLRARPDTAPLLERILRANRRALMPPNADLVHGDCTVDNVLIRNGRPVFVDAEHVGRGTRVYDLATMIYEANVGGTDHRVPPPESITKSYIDAAIGIAGHDTLVHCVTSSMVEFIGFGLDHWSDDISRHVARCQGFLDRLGVPR